MSASREKKQRRSDPQQGLTQKERAELREQKAAKQKTVLYTAVGVIVAILVVILLVWDSGIFQRGATALTVNGRNYNVNDVEYYFRSAMNSAYSSGMTFDTTTDLREQYVDEEQTQTYYDYFMEQAIESLKQVSVLENAAEEAGYTFTEEDQAAVDNTVAYMKSYASQLGASSFEGFLKANYGKYMTPGAYEDCLHREVLVSSYKNTYMDGLDITDDAIQTYYDEHKDELDSFTFRTIQIDGTAPSGTDEEGNTVEPTEAESTAAMQAAKAKADEFAAAVEAAEDKEATFAELAPDYVSESSKENYESDPDYSLTTALSGTSVASRAYGEWLLDASRTVGDVGVVEYDTGYYVVLFQERYLDETPTADIRHILIKAELTQEDDPATEGVDESTVPTQEALDAAKAEAQSLLDEWNAGDKTAESFGALAEANSDDPGSNTNGGLYEEVYKGQMFDAFNDWIFDEARQPGDTTLIENTQSGQQGWHVVYYQGANDPVWKLDADSALREADLNAWLDEQTQGLEAVQGDGMKYVYN